MTQDEDGCRDLRPLQLGEPAAREHRRSGLGSRKLAKLRSLTISDEHIYADQARSGARSDRPALAGLMAADRSGEFDVVLVDDLSRLAN